MKAKTTLTIEVEYDDTKTDPEGLASMLDKVIETGFIVIEDAHVGDYGKPVFHDVYVERPIHVTVEIEGGCCTDANLDEGDKREFSYTVEDHDITGYPEEEDEAQEAPRNPPPGGGIPADE